MDKFTIVNNKIVNKTTTYGLVCINNVFISPIALENAIVEIVSDWDNLLFIFNLSKHNGNRRSVIDRFLPSTKHDDLSEYISHMVEKYPSFYSFLAEGLQAILLRDVFEYHLTTAAVNINSNLTDQQTGVDVCMIDLSKKAFVLGEAKFMKSISAALNKINDCFIDNNSLASKLDNLFRTSKNDSETEKVMIELLGSEDIDEVDLNDFLSFDFIFSGFILHENHLASSDKYLEQKYYDFWTINSNDLKKHLSSLFFKASGNYVLNVFHLPIKSKEDLINQVIVKFYEMRKTEK